jgi:hypothetical protein
MKARPGVGYVSLAKVGAQEFLCRFSKGSHPLELLVNRLSGVNQAGR